MTHPDVSALSRKFAAFHPHELLEHIRKFRQLDLRYEAESGVLDQLKKIIPVKYTIHYTYPAGSEFYRIRKMTGDQPLTRRSELLYPPQEAVTYTGRLNGIGESLLYTSPTPLCLFKEVKMEPDQLFTMIKYRVKEGATLDLVGIGLYDDEHDTVLTGGTYFSDIVRQLSRKAATNYRLIQDFINNEFTKDVGIGTEHLYKASVLIARHFYDAPQVDGFLYPSVASKVGYNAALKPWAVDRAIELVGLRVFRYVGEQENGKRVNTLGGVWANEIVNDAIIYRNDEVGNALSFGGWSEKN